MNGQDDGQGIPLGQGGGGGGGGPMESMGGGGGSDYPDLSMSSDHPDMNEAPEEGSATIHFHKHSHTRERHPSKPGAHKHHVRLKVHSIKFNKPKKRVSKADIAEALASAPPPAPPPGGDGGGGDGGGGMPAPPPPTG